MINRYEDKIVKSIWSDINRINLWKNIELSHVNALFTYKSDLNLHNFKHSDLELINNSLSIDLNKNDLDRMKEIEAETRHDFVSFVKLIEDRVPNKAGRWLHYGLTSSDVIDTANSIRCTNSLIYTRQNITAIITTLLERTKRDDSNTEILSRTHGQAAEVQQVKNIFQRWLSFARRAYDDLILAEKKLKVGKLSGPSGNHVYVTKNIESVALSHFNLQPVANASQIIPRDIYLDYYYALLKAVLLIEKIAFDVRLYSQSEIKEICEGFSEKQKGSSAMPHKKNPVYCENLSGLARLYKGYMMTAIENCETQLERDISHSSSERIIFEDCAHIANFGLIRLNDVLSNLVINGFNCKLNINKNRTKIDSQKILNEKIANGLSRFDSHTIAQKKSR